jgi:hypothetical protein
MNWATNDDEENFAPGVLDQAFQDCDQELDEDSGVDAAFSLILNRSLIMNRISPRGDRRNQTSMPWRATAKELSPACTLHPFDERRGATVV